MFYFMFALFSKILCLHRRELIDNNKGGQATFVLRYLDTWKCKPLRIVFHLEVIFARPCIQLQVNLNFFLLNIDSLKVLVKFQHCARTTRTRCLHYQV